jgi:C-terminal processing protease CtpA/Prc
MKKLLILLTALAVSLSAAAGEKCEGSADDCLAKMKTKLAEKPWLGVEFDKDDHGQLLVKKVYSDSPAEEAGFQKGDIVLTMQGVEYTKANKKAIKEVYAGIKPGSDVQYLVKRQGAKVELDATLAHVPVDLQKKWIAEHMENHHSNEKVASNN